MFICGGLRNYAVNNIVEQLAEEGIVILKAAMYNPIIQEQGDNCQTKTGALPCQPNELLYSVKCKYSIVYTYMYTRVCVLRAHNALACISECTSVYL